MNELKLLDENILKEERINKDLAIEKGLINNDNYEVYAKVQSLYLKGLETILLSTLNLKEYDDEINNSDLDFGLIPDELKQPSHKISYMNLNHIYIRNFLFIEKLSVDSLNIFINKINNNDYNIDDNILYVVKKSYKEVLANNYFKGKYVEVADVIYGPFIPENITKSDELVIVLQYGNNSKELDKDEFFDNRNKKLEFLDNLSKKLSEQSTNALNMKTRIFIRNIYGQ